jgi:hypothetical protein
MRGDVERGLVMLRAADRYSWIWLWKHCLLLSSYLRNEQILIEKINNPCETRSSGHLLHTPLPKIEIL